MPVLAKALCFIGALEVLCSTVAFVVIKCLPFPWGTGLLASGMYDQETMELQKRVWLSSIAVGLMGVLLLLLGSIFWMVSRFKPSI
jgi:hypothetical protein